jgi:hypothetical protein
MKNCMDCSHYRTEKIYTAIGSDRIGLCLKQNTRLCTDEFPNIYNDAEYCEWYNHYKADEERIGIRND